MHCRGGHAIRIEYGTLRLAGGSQNSTTGAARAIQGKDMFGFKGLVSSLVNRDQEGMATNVKSAAQLIQELSEDDALQSQAEIVRIVAQLGTDQAMSLKDRLETLLFLDEKSHKLQRRLCDEFFHQMNGKQQNVAVITSVWNEFAGAYLACERQYRTGPVPALFEGMKLATARGLYHSVMQAKWNWIRYQEVESALWARIHRYYQFAEAYTFAAAPLRLYPGEARYQSCQSLLLRVAMLSTIQPDSLLPLQIEQVDLWLDKWSTEITLDSEIRPAEHLFCLNIKEAASPRRLLRGMTGDGYRYWSSEALVEHIADVIMDIESDSDIPPEFRVLEGLDRSAYVDLLNNLAFRWARVGEQTLRNHERQKIARMMRGWIGLEAILNRLDGLDDIDATPAALQSSTPDWSVLDESTGGLGAMYAGRHGDKLQINGLVLLSLDSEVVKLALVRRLSRLGDGRILVGLRFIGHAPIKINLSQDDGTSIDVLYLPQMNTISGNRVLVSASRALAAGQFYMLSTHGKRYRIRIDIPPQEYPDCALANFEVVEKIG